MVKLKSLSKKATFLVAVAGAAVIGGASTVLVKAAIPDTSGTIHGCYRTGGLLSSGALRVIDSAAGATCKTTETALNWSQSGSTSSAPTVHDANGQTLGMLLRATGADTAVEVYNAALNRTININNGSSGNLEAGTLVRPYFQSSDCTGTAYLEPYPVGLKMTLFYWKNGGTYIPAIVSDSAQPTNINAQSEIIVDEYNPNGACITDTQALTGVYPADTTTLPFTTPIAEPLKF